MRVSCSIGIMAYNEAANIGRLLEAVTTQLLTTVEIAEVVVVASGCTDDTEAIVREWEAKDQRIRLLSQNRREGKASAINLFLASARESVLVLCSGDLVPARHAIEKLVAPFADSEVGMTSSRPVPVNDDEKFMGFAAHLLWGLHHHINLISFKAGEMIALRKIFTRIPYHTAVDEASIEPVIRGQGYKVQYVPEAIVYNKGPETLSDFLKQRRRIYAGHLAIRDLLGYGVSTLSGTRILPILLRNLEWHPKRLAWTGAVVGLEAYSRLLGARDHRAKRDHSVWEIAETTKRLQVGASKTV
jgi:cellulose synthase/poly-beta-1,6-N-acetylglucosamine synthase-like glycosyltransferase